MAGLGPDLQYLSQAAKYGSAMLSKLSKGRLTHTEGGAEGRSPCEGGLPQRPLHRSAHSISAGFIRVSQEEK